MSEKEVICLSKKETQQENRDGKRRYAAIVLAAGRGKRMQSRIQKQFLLLEGKPLLYYSLSSFEQSSVEDVILVTGEQEVEYCRTNIVEEFCFRKVRKVTAGGKERYHSVYEGLKALGELGYGEQDCVLIHDGVRPFVDTRIIGRVCFDAVNYGACAAGMPSKDTVKLSDGEGFARLTPERSSVWTVQTPQAFLYGLIKSAYDMMMSREEYQRGITDDAMVVETMTAFKVKLTEGSYRNIKVTTPEDMAVAEAFLRQKL